ncbi:MAG: cache domain-containing protein, partial [Humidesulfovibrio sp.]|nr:cache domain-containing protein [Humidesulfovibrio sp.]
MKVDVLARHPVPAGTHRGRMFSFLLHGSIRKKLALLFLFAALPALVLIILAGMNNRAKAIADAERELLTFVQQTAEAQERTTAATRLLLENLAQMEVVRQRDAAACSQLLTHVVQVNPFSAALHLVDLNGDMIASSNLKAAKSFAHVKHFKDALATGAFVTGEYLLSVSRNEPVFAFGCPVRDARGSITAVLLTSILLERYGKLLEQTHFPEDSFFGVADHRGIRIFRHPEMGAGPVGLPISGSMFERAKASALEGLTTNLGSDGIERITAFRQLRLGPGQAPYMYMFVGIPKSTVYASVRASTLQELGLLLLTVFLALTSGWFLGGRSLGRKLEELAGASAKLGAGDLSVRVDARSDIAEVAALAKAFNDMSSALSSDIARREMAEEAMLQSKERFRALFVAVSDPVLVADRDTGILVECNEAAER